MTTGDLPAAFAAHWPKIEMDLLEGRYQPQPVRRVSIPKPGGGGERHLGIPTVFDRLIQQAVLQQLQPSWDPTFSEHSYGFRPGRSAHQAVAQAQAYAISSLLTWTWPNFLTGLITTDSWRRWLSAWSTSACCG